VGWMDPLQSFENFRTPFRETQMAILALRRVLPARRPRERLETRLNSNLFRRTQWKSLKQLDNVLGRTFRRRPSPNRRRGKIERCAHSPGRGRRHWAAIASKRSGLSQFR